MCPDIPFPTLPSLAQVYGDGTLPLSALATLPAQAYKEMNSVSQVGGLTRSLNLPALGSLPCCLMA